MGGTKQISLAVPELLFRESKEYSKEYGYRNLQELILDLLRRKLIMEKAERYKKIELEMERTGTKMSQKEAIAYLKRL